MYHEKDIQIYTRRVKNYVQNMCKHKKNVAWKRSIGKKNVINNVRDRKLSTPLMFSIYKKTQSIGNMNAKVYATDMYKIKFQLKHSHAQFTYVISTITTMSVTYAINNSKSKHVL